MREKLASSKVKVMLLAHQLEDCKAINWQQVNRQVRQLRQRIYRASVAGDLHQVGNLQGLMMRSTANKLSAIRHSHPMQLRQAPEATDSCLSRMKGNAHVRFLGRKEPQEVSCRGHPQAPTYPT